MQPAGRQRLHAQPTVEEEQGIKSISQGNTFTGQRAKCNTQGFPKGLNLRRSAHYFMYDTIGTQPLTLYDLEYFGSVDLPSLVDFSKYLGDIEQTQTWGSHGLLVGASGL